MNPLLLIHVVYTLVCYVFRWHFAQVEDRPREILSCYLQEVTRCSLCHYKQKHCPPLMPSLMLSKYNPVYLKDYLLHFQNFLFWFGFKNLCFARNLSSVTLQFSYTGTQCTSFCWIGLCFYFWGHFTSSTVLFVG